MIEVASLLTAALRHDSATCNIPTLSHQIAGHDEPTLAGGCFGRHRSCRFDMLVGECAGEQFDARLVAREFEPHESEPTSECAEAASLLQKLLARRTFAHKMLVRRAPMNPLKRVLLGGIDELLAAWDGRSDVNVGALGQWILADLHLRLGDHQSCAVLARQAGNRWLRDANFVAAGHAALSLGDGLAGGAPMWLQQAGHSEATVLVQDGWPAPTPGANLAAAREAYQQAERLFTRGANTTAAAQARLRLALLHASAQGNGASCDDGCHNIECGSRSAEVKSLNALRTALTAESLSRHVPAPA